MKNILTNTIGWSNGEWGTINQLNIPICDRGITLGDGIFETILIYNGKVKLLRNHLDRWERSASILRMAPPPSEQWLRPLINEAIERASLTKGNGTVRLNWSRGNNLSRGINIQSEINENSIHRFWLEIHSAEPYFNSISTMISRHEQRNANSQITQCKTFAYGQSIQARQEAKLAGFDDALLVNNNGEICCGAAANLIVKRHNQWITPRLKSGCLPGIMRKKGLDSGLIKEAKINSSPEQGDQWLLINSLSCQPISKLNSQSLEIFPNAKNFWFSLMN